MFIKQYYSIKDKLIPFISGSKGSKGCFAAGTLIETKTGKKFIENILPGDLVKSFDHYGNYSYSKVLETFKHTQQEIIKINLWSNKELYVTANHWFLTELNTFKEIQDFNITEALVGIDKQKFPIESIEYNFCFADTYNFTVENDHTYIANDILVHNKGGGKSANTPTQADDNLFSIDLLFVLTALGEGPIYKVNPNGPMDIEINESNIDNLLIPQNGQINEQIFYYASNTGTVNQPPLGVFGAQVLSPQSLSSPVTLRNGNIAAIAPGYISTMATSIGTPWNQLNFKFNLSDLFTMDSEGNVYGYTISISTSVFDSTGQTTIATGGITINGKTTSDYRFSIDIPIPEQYLSDLGYTFSVYKTSPDSNSSNTQDNCQFFGWDEIQNSERAYPRTALCGYVISSTSEYQGSVPSVTSMVKGLLCRVPSNYNQPVLASGEIDWRQVEVQQGNACIAGYYLQNSGGNILQGDEFTYPQVYVGLWDGSFTYNWTQNPIWIVFEILTNTIWGLGIPIENIDIYNFYKVSQYCDAVDQSTGQFVGVVSTADGTWRYQPQGTASPVIMQIGLPNGTPVVERRFIFDGVIAAKKQVMDVINLITASFRGILYYTAGKLALNVDMPDELPMAIFNETNIIDGSLKISGNKETDIFTAVDLTYIEPLQHYTRETIRVSDDNILREVNQIDNIKAIELTGCTRRSQATRFAQYILASGKYLRRKVSFSTSLEAIQLTIGDIISVSTKVAGTSWGNAGRIFANAAINNNQVYLEHFTVPGLDYPIFTSNTNPLSLRIINQDSDRVDYYLISNNNYSLLNTGNVTTGYDVAVVSPIQRYNPTTRTWENYTAWGANNVPVKNDMWTMGEVDPNNIFTSQADKLFKITQLQRAQDMTSIQIDAMEYISNVFIDSETLISYSAVQYTDFSSSLVTPPAPMLEIVPRTVANPDGSLTYVLDINSSTNTTGYPVNISTNFEIAYLDTLTDIIGIN